MDGACPWADVWSSRSRRWVNKIMWIDDDVLRHYERDFCANVFVPKSPMVVLGSGNDEALEVNIDQCHALGVPILRRYGGGGTVVLYSGCVVVSAGCWVSEAFQNTLFFKRLNQAVIDALAVSWPVMASLGQAGISDIVSGSKKIAGTSMFRSRNYLLYQASILVRLDLDLVTNTLRHPSKEPDYRRGRGHKDFLSDIQSHAASPLSSDVVAHVLDEHFYEKARIQLDSYLIEPIAAQMPALSARLQRAAE
jgi:lipoate-protein ligase A